MLAVLFRDEVERRLTRRGVAVAVAIGVVDEEEMGDGRLTRPLLFPDVLFALVAVGLEAGAFPFLLAYKQITSVNYHTNAKDSKKIAEEHGQLSYQTI